ncbi:hypothetical protein KKA27_03440 [Patescibacteria group bacterium]|nr:hypothetical protein [Patescibacteria group bacterium]
MENVEIRNIKAMESKQFRARFDVAFKTVEFGTICIKGFRLGKSIYGDEVWIQEPAYQFFGKHIGLFFMENKGVWQELKREALETCKENGIDLSGINLLVENISPEEVTI